MKLSFTTARPLLLGAAVASLCACAVTPQVGHAAAQAPTQSSAPAAAPAPPAVAALPKHIVLLYRKETAAAPNRLDTRIQTTGLALEREFQNRQYSIVQPSAEALQALDQGPDVIVNFAADAGLSMIYSVYTDLRPQVGADVGIAEVRIDARVFVGAMVLSSEQGRGQIQVRLDPATREYGERRGYEIAAQRAAQDLAMRIQARLDALSTEQIAAMIGQDSPANTSFVVVTPAATPPPVTPPPVTPPPVTPPAVAAQPAPTSPPATAPAPPASSPTAPAVANDAPPPAPVNGKRWLVTIGVSDYSHVLGTQDAGTHKHDLPGTPKDMSNVQDTLTGFGFTSSTRLFDGEATTSNVRVALDRLTSSAGPGDTVVLYITGHGMPKPYGRAGVTMPLFYDTDVSSRAGAAEAIDFGEIATRFSQIPARQLVLLIDTCFSGTATTGIAMTTVTVSSRGVQVSRSTGAPDIARLLPAKKAGSTSDIAIMTAARPDEVSWDLGPTKGGLFTNNLLHGLGETAGRQPLEAVYQQYVWPAVIDKSRDICQHRPPNDSCVQQSPLLGYTGAGNLIKLGAEAK